MIGASTALIHPPPHLWRSLRVHGSEAGVSFEILARYESEDTHPTPR